MSGLGFLDGERVVFEAQTVHEMAESVRKMNANNAELSASLEAALKRIDELEGQRWPDGIDEKKAASLRDCASTCVDDDFVSIDEDARIIRVEGEADDEGYVCGGGYHVAAWIWLPDVESEP